MATVEVYHSNAYLPGMRNVTHGLTTRTKILVLIEEEPKTAKDVAQGIGASYSRVLHHLHLMEHRKVVERVGSRPSMWRVTGMGQGRLDRFVRKYDSSDSTDFGESSRH